MFHLFTHNDLDGVGCGILAKLAFQDQVRVRYNSVSGLDFQVERFLERAKNDDFIIVTDLSVNEQNTKKINEYYKKTSKAKLIDHHKTALHFNDYEWGSVKVEYDDGRLTAATSLFYEYLVANGQLESSPVVEEFVELVRLYDTWEWEKNNNETAKRLNDLFFMISIEDFEERMAGRLQESDSFSFDEFETKILDMEENKIERYVRRKRREMVQTFIDSKCVGIVHAENYHSELGNELGKENPHLDYIAIMNVGGKKISLRTIHDHIDVSEVAGQFGGGGHAKASGCPLTDQAYQLFVAEAFRIEPMKPDAFRNQYNLKAAEKGCYYENHFEDQFFVYRVGENKWCIDRNGKVIEQTFTAFDEAEYFLKRNHAAWLARDEQYVDYLSQTLIQTIKKEQTNEYEKSPEKGMSFATYEPIVHSSEQEDRPLSH
ncbi:DHH family phosphoesterase [Alkalihalobacterium chitinilyticum]|uniref:Oligoribonuclease n=1 Tax=Alkalihalobacterium chitinilyticum TaxID=2980103 RepID=A0ABT5VC40_9BACI|nr:oligoribonuclease [Alkalihalobacterium chitinilyticum]MDE5412726.1 oligoribonuclease [Alkalihalobacterium chitinilyticum]